MSERPLYRFLHGAPMLGGVPAHYALGLVAVGSVVGLGLVTVERLLGLLVMAAVVATWFLVALVFAQDRALVPLLIIGIVSRLPSRVTSYSPSSQRIAVVGHGSAPVPDVDRQPMRGVPRGS